MIRLRTTAPEVVVVPALWYHDRRIERVLVKSEVGRTYADSRGTYRWITVHPHGKDDTGQPIKIRESSSQPGVWHVVGGAGGKLNYLKLTGVKSPEEYKRRAKEKQQRAKEQESTRREARRQRMARLTPEERQAERAADRLRKANQEELAQRLEIQKREFVKNIAEQLGWDKSEWQFDEARERLQKAGASPKRIEQLEIAHWKRVYTRAQDAVEAIKRQIVLDAEMRAEAALGELPLRAEDPDVIALADLDPDKLQQSLGYQRDTTKMSDQEITAAIAGEDLARLEGERERLLQGLSPDDRETKGELDRVEAEIRAARAIRENADKSPEELKAREQEIERAVRDVRNDQAEYVGELDELRKQQGKDEVRSDAEMQRLADLEQMESRDKQRLEALQAEQQDLAVVMGRADPLVGAERKEFQQKHRAEREREIAAEGKDVEAYRQRRDMMEKRLKEYQSEIAAYKAKAVITKPDLPTAAVQDPDAALQILKHAKAIKEFERKVAKAQKKEGQNIDIRLFGHGYFVETSTAQVGEAVRKEIAEEVKTRLAQSFLREIDEMDAAPNLAELSADEKRKNLERHLSAGSYNALNDLSHVVMGQPVLSREVVDTLGASAAAQVLAQQIRQTHQGEDLDDVIKGLSDYHVAHQREAAEEAMTSAHELLEQAREVELGMAANPAELQVQQELNARRREKLLAARQMMGQTLGELEAYGALNLALREGEKKEVHIALGPIATDSAIRQLRALGLSRGDYSLDSDGTNRFATIQASGFGKLAKPIDAHDLHLDQEIAAIKRGERDEENWVAPGLASWPAAAFADPQVKADSFSGHQQTEAPFEKWDQLTGGGTGAGQSAGVEHLEAYIGARMADGDDPNDILPDVLANVNRIPQGERQAVLNHLDKILPVEVPLTEKGKPVYQRDAQGRILTGEDGKPIPRMRRVKADYHEEQLRGLADRYIQQKYGASPTVAAFHAQSLKTDTPEAAETTARAVYVALARDPRTMVAFKDPGDLSSQDQAAIRHYFNTEIAKLDPKTGVDVAAVEAKVKALGPEPEKSRKGLFGTEEVTPEWVEWNHRLNAITSEAQDSGSAWSEYVHSHGNTRDAYQALQGRMKNDFLDRFQRSYAAMHGEPLRLGKRSIAHAERHLAVVDPEAYGKEAEKLGKVRDALRVRTQGRYAAGSVKDRVDRALQEGEIMRQNQISLFGTGPAPKERELEVGAGERMSIGERAEHQLAPLVAHVGRNLHRAMDQPVDLFPRLRMSGKVKVKGAEVDLTEQQRTIKGFLARKRVGAFLGTGSGKTLISIGAFTAAASDPKTGVKRGIFVVPSQVQGQFHGELARFVDPAKFNWHAAPGASAEERMAAHQDPKNHITVMTHQGLRDDMLKLVSEQRGISSDKAGKWFMGLSRSERAKALREAWQKSGIDYQASFLDEGHVTLDRRGKKDSLLSAVMTAVSDNTPYHMAMTADPSKNDISEIRSQLDKLYPDGRYSDEAAWHRRYGINTTVSRDAIRREVQGNFFVSHIQPPVEARHAEDRVRLHPEQAKQVKRVNDLANKIRADRAAGRINVEAVKSLSPENFEGAPKAKHEEIARRLTDSIGMIRDHALNRAINTAPLEHNAKLQALVKRLKDHPVKDKPVVIFAHNLSAVHEIESAVGKAGHRVVTLTGEHTSREKDRRRQMFQPDGSAQKPEADVIVLSDAGATGLNLQRGQTLINYDTPMTAMVHNQRNGRIFRLGQQRDVDMIDLVADTAFEETARQRLQRKYDLRSITAAPPDDSGPGEYIARARNARLQLPASMAA